MDRLAAVLVGVGIALLICMPMIRLTDALEARLGRRVFAPVSDRMLKRSLLVGAASLLVGIAVALIDAAI